MAAKDNDTPSTIDKTSFFWVGLCGVCHPGGGPGEYDRNGALYWDAAAKKYGYETSNQKLKMSRYDGDYTVLNPSTGQIGQAPWHVTGVAEPDCMMCHRKDRAVDAGKNMNWIWRAGTLRGGAALVDAANQSVPAYAAAPTAGQGWISQIVLANVPAGAPPQATLVQIDYEKGIGDGSLLADAENRLAIDGDRFTKTPGDYACWGCHITADQKKRGRVWFDPNADVHYAGFNKLRDLDPTNDVPALASKACLTCHVTGADHNIGKGNANLGSVQNETDYEKLRTCVDCHAKDSATRDPSAPPPTHAIHTLAAHRDAMSCQFCHVPYKTAEADLAIDNATTGSTVGYGTKVFLSADPLDPMSQDKTAWYPDFKAKKDEDGKTRYFPAKRLLSIWWGDWDQRGTPNNPSDDIIAPIALWRVRQVTKGQALPGVTDDNKDGKPEVNRLAEIALYLAALKANDSHGNPTALRPVLVKGGRVYHEDATSPDGVSWFDYESTGMKVESSHPFSIDHNVLPAKQALGGKGCHECHRAFNNDRPTAVFERLILLDPYGLDGKPVYTTVRQLLTLDPN